MHVVLEIIDLDVWVFIAMFAQHCSRARADVEGRPLAALTITGEDVTKRINRFSHVLGPNRVYKLVYFLLNQLQAKVNGLRIGVKNVHLW